MINKNQKTFLKLYEFNLNYFIWALHCYTLPMMINWHKVEIIIFFHFFLESYNIKTKFCDRIKFSWNRLLLQLKTMKFNLHLLKTFLQLCISYTKKFMKSYQFAVEYFYTIKFLFNAMWPFEFKCVIAWEEKTIQFPQVMIERWWYEKANMKGNKNCQVGNHMIHNYTKKTSLCTIFNILSLEF
jgi:hypothetical protein